MKKVFLVISAIFFILNINAQSWCPPGATWYPGVYSGLWGYDGITEYRYTKDTLIQNINCKTIKGTFSGQNVPDYGTLTYTYVPNFRTYYTYETNNVVYVFSGSSFDTVVNFNAHIGDKWRMLKCGNDTATHVYTVTDTLHVVINNMSLRSVKASFLYTQTDTSGVHTYTLNHVFTERILGGPIGWEDLFGRGCFHKVNSGEAFGWPTDCGYKDDSFSTLNSNGGGACRLTGITENSASQIHIGVYPNPTAGRFTVEVDQLISISITNSLGSKVYETHFKDAGPYEINIEELAAGVYYLEARTAKGRSYQKIIKDR